MYHETGSRPSFTGDPWASFNTGWSTSEGYDDDGALRNSWKAFAISSDQQIRNLVQVYFEIVYPMYDSPPCMSTSFCIVLTETWLGDSLFSISSHSLKELIIKSTSETRGYLLPPWQYVRWFRDGRAMARYTLPDGAGKSSSSLHQKPFTQQPRILCLETWPWRGASTICVRAQYLQSLAFKMARSRTYRSTLACTTR